MHPPSMARKRAWLKEKKNRVIHTVIFDDRDKFDDGANRHQYSGRRTYYRKGMGSFRLKRDMATSMNKIKEIFTPSGK